MEVLGLLLLALSAATAVHHRRGGSSSRSDSILDIINTKEVERLVAANRRNVTRQERRYLAQNDLDEDFQNTNPQVINYEPPEYAPERHRPRNHNNRLGLDILLRQYNDSQQQQGGGGKEAGPELLTELAAYHGLKLLKSSKNALVVTKKEYLKRDWCKTEPLMQRVREEGCATKTVVNKFCYGQCNSFYIPKNPRRRRMRPVAQADERDDIDQNGGAAFRSCAFCKPKRFSWITVTLRCPDLVPPYRKKRIQRIKQCKCTAADVN